MREKQSRHVPGDSEAVLLVVVVVEVVVLVVAVVVAVVVVPYLHVMYPSIHARR